MQAGAPSQQLRSDKGGRTHPGRCLEAVQEPHGSLWHLGTGSQVPRLALASLGQRELSTRNWGDCAAVRPNQGPQESN